MNPSLGQIAYEAWRDDLFDPFVALRWDELSPIQHNAWEAAATAVTAALLNDAKMPAGKVE